MIDQRLIKFFVEIAKYSVPVNGSMFSVYVKQS